MSSSPMHRALETFQIDFSAPNLAVAYLTLFNGRQLTWEIGLDGVYHSMADGSARLGSWVDPQTFAFDVIRRRYPDLPGKIRGRQG